MKKSSEIPPAPAVKSRPPLPFLKLAGLASLLLASLLAGCQPPPPAAPLPTAPAQLTHLPLSGSPACSGSFVPHRLDFTTGTRLREIGTYISNGAGVAANDLDQDGLLDLVFASVDGDSAILWNEGGLDFTPQPLPARFTRAVSTVDVDGDGWTDLFFTHRGRAGISFWHNQGPAAAGERPHFEPRPLTGVDSYAYAMGWGDSDGDGRLDLVTGSYGAELIQHGVAANDPQAGVHLHLQQENGWQTQVLAPNAETLSLAFLDLTGDGHPEIWAANDFGLEDHLWTRQGTRWQTADLFAQTSYSTMTIEWGDIANNGQLTLFTTDMNPYDIRPHTLAAWLPTVTQLTAQKRADDVQVMANVLLTRANDGRWHDQATRQGVDASGWSWAARYGDLDQDGLLDLYVVNGMIAADLFGHLPNAELVEENQAYRNQGQRFTPAPEWQLGSTASGRGMLMADLDNDGDLDVAVNNLRNFAHLHENQLCSGASLQVELQWLSTQNRSAIGAQLLLTTDSGILRRDVRASGGYLSGDPTRLHFGFPTGTTLQRLDVYWPDGTLSSFEHPPDHGLLRVTR
ncbi:MAG: CRTAC1 family protein [Caldilinea sp.]